MAISGSPACEPSFSTIYGLRFLLVEAAQVTVRSQAQWLSKFFHLPCGVDGRSSHGPKAGGALVLDVAPRIGLPVSELAKFFLLVRRRTENAGLGLSSYDNYFDWLLLRSPLTCNRQPLTVPSPSLRIPRLRPCTAQSPAIAPQSDAVRRSHSRDRDRRTRASAKGAAAVDRLGRRRSAPFSMRVQSER